MSTVLAAAISLWEDKPRLGNRWHKAGEETHKFLLQSRPNLLGSLPRGEAVKKSDPRATLHKMQGALSALITIHCGAQSAPCDFFTALERYTACVKRALMFADLCRPYSEEREHVDHCAVYLRPTSESP